MTARHYSKLKVHADGDWSPGITEVAGHAAGDWQHIKAGWVHEAGDWVAQYNDATFTTRRMRVGTTSAIDDTNALANFSGYRIADNGDYMAGILLPANKHLWVDGVLIVDHTPVLSFGRYALCKFDSLGRLKHTTFLDTGATSSLGCYIRMASDGTAAILMKAQGDQPAYTGRLTNPDGTYVNLGYSFSSYALRVITLDADGFYVSKLETAWPTGLNTSSLYFDVNNDYILMGMPSTTTFTLFGQTSTAVNSVATSFYKIQKSDMSLVWKKQAAHASGTVSVIPWSARLDADGNAYILLTNATAKTPYISFDGEDASGNSLAVVFKVDTTGLTSVFTEPVSTANIYVNAASMTLVAGGVLISWGRNTNLTASVSLSGIAPVSWGTSTGQLLSTHDTDGNAITAGATNHITSSNGVYPFMQCHEIAGTDFLYLMSLASNTSAEIHNYDVMTGADNWHVHIDTETTTKLIVPQLMGKLADGSWILKIFATTNYITLTNSDTTTLVLNSPNTDYKGYWFVSLSSAGFWNQLELSI